MTNSRGACNKMEERVPFPTAPLKTEQEGVFCSDSVFIGMLRHITHATARPVTYGVLLCGILTSHLITSVMNSILLHNTLIHAQLIIRYGENIDQRSKPSWNSLA